MYDDIIILTNQAFFDRQFYLFTCFQNENAIDSKNQRYLVCFYFTNRESVIWGEKKNFFSELRLRPFYMSIIIYFKPEQRCRLLLKQIGNIFTFYSQLLCLSLNMVFFYLNFSAF